MTKAEMQAMWKDSFAVNYNTVAALVDEVQPFLLKYEGKPALACYHAISCGNTEFSENVWGQPTPYLVQVDSSFDAGAEGFIGVKTFTAQEMHDALMLGFSGLDLSGAPELWFGTPSYSAAGYALTVPVGGATVSGKDLRERLGLRSSCLVITCENETFTIATKGYGHGVGMSQVGANHLAGEGKTYQQILAYYFPGTSLE